MASPSESEAEIEAETNQSSMPDPNGSKFDDRSQDDKEMDVNIDFRDGVVLLDPSEDVGLSLPASSMDEDIMVASSTHLSSGPPTRSSSTANNPSDYSSFLKPQAEPSSTATAYQQPTHTVRHRVLADEGMIDSIEGCSPQQILATGRWQYSMYACCPMYLFASDAESFCILASHPRADQSPHPSKDWEWVCPL